MQSNSLLMGMQRSYLAFGRLVVYIMIVVFHGRPAGKAVGGRGVTCDFGDTNVTNVTRTEIRPNGRDKTITGNVETTLPILCNTY